MNWLNRYVLAVKNHLPSSSRDDIGDELLANLEDQLSSFEEQKDRSLTDDEICDWLKTLKSPITVAASYQTHRALIGKELFPYYALSLKMTLLSLFAVMVALSVLNTLTGINWIDSVWGMFDNLLVSFSVTFTLVTLLFAGLEHSPIKSKFIDRWDPSKLPSIASQYEWQNVPRYVSVTTIIFSLIAMSILNALFTPSNIGSQISTTSYFSSLLPWINLIITVNILLYLAHLFSPMWTRQKLIVDMLIQLGSILIWWHILGYGGMVTDGGALIVSAINVNAEATKLAGHINQIISVSAAIAIMVLLFEFLRDGYRLMLLNRK